MQDLQEGSSKEIFSSQPGFHEERNTMSANKLDTRLMRHLDDSFDAVFGKPIDGRETLEYKALKALDRPCLICHHTDCTCCAGCIEISAQCDDCACDAPYEHESQGDYEARSYGVPRSGPI